MGLESYLFQIQFASPVKRESILPLFEQAGMKHVESNTQIDEYCYFELRAEGKLTEAECIFNDGKTLFFCHLRFAMYSPISVIEQTFEVMRKLNELQPMKVYDVEPLHEGKGEPCEIPMDKEIFKRNELGLWKRETLIKG